MLADTFVLFTALPNNLQIVFVFWEGKRKQVIS